VFGKKSGVGVFGMLRNTRVVDDEPVEDVID
jgi:hypothetical protein